MGERDGGRNEGWWVGERGVVGRRGGGGRKRDGGRTEGWWVGERGEVGRRDGGWERGVEVGRRGGGWERVGQRAR